MSPPKTEHKRVINATSQLVSESDQGFGRKSQGWTSHNSQILPMNLFALSTCEIDYLQQCFLTWGKLPIWGNL